MFGIEIEFGIPYGSMDKIHESIRPLGWICKVDATADCDPYEGAEIVTLKPWSLFPRHTLETTLDVVRFYGPKVNRWCGLHFHFSGFGRISNITAAKIYLQRKIKFWPERAEYLIGNHPKETVLRHVQNDHYEVRIFNSTLSVEKIVEHWEFTKRFIEEFTRG